MKKTNKVKFLSLLLSFFLVIGVISSFIVFSENDSDTSKKPSVEITNCSHSVWEDWEAYGNYHGRKCQNCSEIEYLSHEYNENGICKDCGAEENGEVETHECKFNTAIQLNRVNPTCTQEGVCYFPCEFSGCDKTKESVLDLIPHQYSGDWQELDDVYHKQICKMCNSAYRTEKHRFNSYVSKPATSTTEGEKTKTCGVCQKTIIEVIPALGDTSDTTGDISTDSPEIEKCTHSRTTYEYINLLYHYATCSDCEAATKAMHLCFERNSPKYNVFISDNANKHRQTCPCGYSIDADHTFTDNSDFCVYCGACNWHIYSSIISSYDSASGEYVNQYVCEVCGYAKTYTCDPVFVDRVKSTCTTQGYAEAECSDCRGTIVIYKPLVPHSYSAGYCSICGVADPDYTPSAPDDACSHVEGAPTATGEYINIGDSTYHNVPVEVRCELCDELLQSYNETDFHEFENGLCSYCGYPDPDDSGGDDVVPSCSHSETILNGDCCVGSMECLDCGETVSSWYGDEDGDGFCDSCGSEMYC